MPRTEAERAQLLRRAAGARAMSAELIVCSQALASRFADEQNRERHAGVGALRNVPQQLDLVRQSLVRAASDRGSMSPDVAATLEMLAAHRAAIDQKLLWT
jgi:hypothetical protein